MPNDILAKLNRLLITTPEGAFACPPVPRATIAAAASEIATLRRQVAELEAAGDDLAACTAALAAAAAKVEA